MWDFSSRRSPVYSRHGMVACTQPLAAECGLSILKAGGNAIDAAIAVAAAMNVTEPCSTGLGGDCFCLYYEKSTGKVHGLNGSGRSPKALSLDRLRSEFAPGAVDFSMNPRHVHAITVPGAAAGWCDAMEAWGTLPLSTVLAPAIQLAREGFPVAPVASVLWEAGEAVLKRGPHAAELLMSNGKAPAVGEVFTNPHLADVLEDLCEGGSEAFYKGRVGREIINVIQSLGGVMSMEDLAEHHSTFVEPIHVNYRGVDVYEVPPNGQGITALIALNVLEGFDLTSMGHNTPEYLHTLIEATRLAFADSKWYVCDPTVDPSATVTFHKLLDKSYAAARRSLITADRAAVDVVAGSPVLSSDTVSFQVTDAAGNAVAFINSNYMGFGSGIVPKGCGFSLQNRGANFSLLDGHPNVFAPGKRPYHTIIPGMALKDGRLFASFSVMGGFMQPQGHVQVMANLIDFGMDPQTALDKPRYCIAGNGTVHLDEGLPATTIDALKRMGHCVEIVTGSDRVAGEGMTGRGQIITQNPITGVYCGGTDGRGDGSVFAY